MPKVKELHMNSSWNWWFRIIHGLNQIERDASSSEVTYLVIWRLVLWDDVNVMQVLQVGSEGLLLDSPTRGVEWDSSQQIPTFSDMHIQD